MKGLANGRSIFRKLFAAVFLWRFCRMDGFFIRGRRFFIGLRVFRQRPLVSGGEEPSTPGFFLRFISRNRNAFRFCFDRVFIRQTAGQFKLVKHG